MKKKDRLESIRKANNDCMKDVVGFGGWNGDLFEYSKANHLIFNKLVDIFESMGVVVPIYVATNWHQRIQRFKGFKMRL